jgi:predicted nuclease of predicted toxin-antitoxin system
MKKVLIDECLPRRLLRDLHEFHATTVPQRGWAGQKDSDLLSLASPEFDVFVTLDSNLAFQ